MSASNEWTEWHLTPNGWVRGTEKMEGVKLEEIPCPADTVLSMKYREFLGSAYSKLGTSLSEVWRSSDEDAINELKKRHGECPRTL
ncbi:MAG: hypothetical protein EOP84_28655 [Verrucomicrobiaceae bacterium]|nr:MAG: hypothetical protein EOP84_28655 [Verrucomicrobiaceae bacterium]